MNTSGKANSLFGEQAPQRNPWVEQQTLAILSGQTERVIADLRVLIQQAERAKVQRQVLETAANYFQRNLTFMRYHDYLAHGWPIASGVIEGACRHLVKDRFELSGMLWSQSGAGNLLRLRAVAENGDWDHYHQFRKQQRHQRLYNSSSQHLRTPKEQALARASSSVKIIKFQQAVHRPPPAQGSATALGSMNPSQPDSNTPKPYLGGERQFFASIEREKGV